jgi:predicted membrane channel-forming protein YqfA (hemolysin III family)
MSGDGDGLTDKGKLLFGAGFAFGVVVTMLILAVVLVVARSKTGASAAGNTPFLATVAGGVVFAAIVGAGLYVLAFPENRTRIPVDPEQFGREPDSTERTDDDTDAE